MTRTGRRAAFAAVAAAAVLLAAVAFFFRSPATPSEAEGRAWLAGFTNRLVDPRSWGARGADALALFPGLGSWSNDGCVTTWSRRDPAAPIVTFQRLELGRLQGDRCDQAQFGMLSTILRSSEGVTPGAVVEDFTGRFGAPEVHRDAALRGSVSYRWLMADGIFATVEEKVGPGAGDTFSVLFMRSYAAPTALASQREGEAWMDRTVSLLAGPALLGARGLSVVALLGDDMQPQEPGVAGCVTIYGSDLLRKGPIVGETMLILDTEQGAPCGQARFSSLFLRVWQREPVTAGSLATRLEAALGPPTVRRDFGRDSVTYHWATPHGTAVELSESLSAAAKHWLGLRAWRS